MNLKPLYLDSVIAPSALNLQFYNKVNTLAPFGSGNPEPKFVIEDVKSINNKIINKFIHWLKFRISKYNKITFQIEGNPMYENDVSTNLVFT